jgi:hypothetical protein
VSADGVWGEGKPSLQETRVHAKCLRSLPLVRDYFRNYRAKKKVGGAAAKFAFVELLTYALYCEFGGLGVWLWGCCVQRFATANIVKSNLLF